jgi:hypothetical protein
LGGIAFAGDVRVFAVRFPSGRVIGDAFPNAVQFVFVTNDAFEMIALLCQRTGRVAHGVNAFGDDRFKTRHNRTNGFGFRARRGNLP